MRSTMNPRDELWMRRLDGDRAIALDAEGEAEAADYERFCETLRETVRGGVDVDAVMLAVELNDAVFGGIDVDAVMASVELNAALEGGIDIDAVMASVALNDAVAGGIDVDAVMDEIDTRAVVEDEEPSNIFALPAPAPMPRWISIGAMPAALLAAAAAVLFAVWPMATVSSPTQEIVAKVADPSFRLSALNQADIEDVSVDDKANVQIIQNEDGGPTIILIDDPRG